MASVRASRGIEQLAAWLRLLVLATLVAACGGGDSGPPPVSVTAITVTGMPTQPLVPMQTVQLGAQAAHSDGSVKDVSSTATWSTTDASVLSVSSTGLLTATGPGQAQVVVSFGGVSGQAGLQVATLPAAYFLDGVEYAFEYQLDAQGRVDNYRISQRPGVAYAAPPGLDSAVIECSGSLRGDYTCVKLPGGAQPISLKGFTSGSVIVSYGPYGGMSYNYAANRLSDVKSVGFYPGRPGQVPWTAWTLTYDDAGNLSNVGRQENVCGLPSCTLYPVSITKITDIDPSGRLWRANGGVDGGMDTRWSYTAAGWMEDVVTTYSSGTFESTRYEVDPDGWLRSRVVRDEGSQPATVTMDSYVIIRWGAGTAEEQFTQAEPAEFYIRRGAQRVRYEWGRLPTEPTFVPRALTGLNGADYFGIISSHHR